MLPPWRTRDTPLPAIVCKIWRLRSEHEFSGLTGHCCWPLSCVLRHCWHTARLLETQQCQEDCPCFQNRVVVLGKGKPNCFSLLAVSATVQLSKWQCPPSSLQKCRDLHLSALASGFPSHHAYLTSNCGLHLPLSWHPHHRLSGCCPMVMESCTYALPAFALSCFGPAPLSWHPLPFTLSLYKGAAVWRPVWSEGGLALLGLCCSSLAYSTAKNKFGGLCSNLPKGMTSRESHRATSLRRWDCSISLLQPDKLEYLCCTGCALALATLLPCPELPPSSGTTSSDSEWI